MPMKSHLSRLAKNRAGNIAISTALSAPLLLGVLAMGVDYGYLTLQQRSLQSTADLAAIAAASNVASADKAMLDYFTLNQLNFAVLTSSGLLTTKGLVPFDPNTVYNTYDAYAEATPGRYLRDKSVASSARFQPGTAPYDAVKVTLHQKGQMVFAASLTSPPTLGATGTASVDKAASFSIGSRLASLNEGIVNALLGKLLGTTVSLTAMDYNSLVNTQVDLLKTLDVLATDLNLTAGTYSDLLQTDITYPRLLQALGKTTGLTPAVSAIVNNLAKAVDKTKVTLKLQDILTPGLLEKRLIGQAEGLTVNASLMQIISAAAMANQNGNQLDLNLGAILPGLAAVKVSLAIGQPPANTPSLAVGSPGTIVRTAQTRLSVEATVDGLSSLLGIKVRVPLYVEVAYAEAQLAAITCSGSGKPQPTVDIDAIPGIAEIALGDVDKTAFANFGKDPRVVKADIVTAPLVSVSALANATATNVKPNRLTFSPSEIAAGKVKSVSTQDTLTTLTGSLLRNLEVEIKVLLLPLVIPKQLTAALADTLEVATVPLDSLLYNLLLTLGVKVGEADVKVGGATCRNPVLVQ